MKASSNWIRYDEVELGRAGEVADDGVRHIGGFVGGDTIVPDTHLILLRGHSLQRRATTNGLKCA